MTIEEIYFARKTEDSKKPTLRVHDRMGKQDAWESY